MEQTLLEYDREIAYCKEIFLSKMRDYGSSWRILRPASLTDQIYIKAQRIRSIEEKGIARIAEGIRPEFAGIINYSTVAVIQIELAGYHELNLEMDEAMTHYMHQINKARTLMMDKNHDYEEAWRNMRVSSLTDIILMRLMRLKQIEDNAGTTIASEGPESNYLDMINYAVFALIKLTELSSNK
jgi:hypothetical protein